ncbi:MAG: phosphoribosylamine--glycine ligase [Clostridiales bacterium]|jgi:phosphoribosylamine--glycine ligase|nr:phosphoribosylamine--glycine ligase [Clostridiales bacterium]
MDNSATGDCGNFRKIWEVMILKILVIGSGAREHAICWALSKNPKVTRLYAAPGNAGIAEFAQCNPIAPLNFEELIAFAKNVGIDLTICPMETPLVAGIVDAFEAANLRIFGPNKSASRIEGSKIFAKDFMRKYGIPTAHYQTHTTFESAMVHAATATFPLVIKADGLAAGKGVFICPGIESAHETLDTMFNKGAFGAAGRKVVIEEFMTGVECSVLCFCDGENIVPMESARDHKPVFDNDYGPNTGGMGVISPNPAYTDEMAQITMEKILLPTMRGFKHEKIDFVGVLFVGLMLTKDGPKVVEYNCRPGDPETQALLPRLDTDFLEIIEACLDKNLDNIEIKWKNNAVCCVVAASKGYPGDFKTGFEIRGLRDYGSFVQIFLAGTKKDKNSFFTDGGRVLNVVASGATLEDARNEAYKALSGINFTGMHYRTDIGEIKN